MGSFVIMLNNNESMPSVLSWKGELIGIDTSAARYASLLLTVKPQLSTEDSENFTIQSRGMRYRRVVFPRERERSDVHFSIRKLHWANCPKATRSPQARGRDRDGTRGLAERHGTTRRPSLDLCRERSDGLAAWSAERRATATNEVAESATWRAFCHDKA